PELLRSFAQSAQCIAHNESKHRLQCTHGVMPVYLRKHLLPCPPDALTYCEGLLTDTDTNRLYDVVSGVTGNTLPVFRLPICQREVANQSFIIDCSSKCNT